MMQIMLAETEKQSWFRQMQRAQRALADAMYFGARREEPSPPIEMPIKKLEASEVKKLDFQGSVYDQLIKPTVP
jgi:hypothetical protein